MKLDDIKGAKYVYDLSKIQGRIEELVRKTRGSKLYYSMKANHNYGVLKKIASSGAMCAEVCSVGEIVAASNAGFDMRDAIFGGPGKEMSDIIRAFQYGIKTFSLESLNELKLILSFEKKERVNLKKVLRVAPPVLNTTRLSMAGQLSKFGVTPEEIAELPFDIRSRVYGIHVYFGSQVSESDAFGTHVDHINAITKSISGLLPELKFINYGGGLGWPYLSDGDSIIRDYRVPDVLENFTSAFEFGRYVVASSGSLITRVLDVKQRNGVQVVVLESGLHHLAGIAATGRILKNKITVNVIGGGVSEGCRVRSAIYGPLCTPLDYLDLDIYIPSVSIGDILTIPNAGAYAYSTRMSDFLLRPEVGEDCV